MPVTHVDGYFLFPGGAVRRATWRERLGLRLGLRIMVTP